MIKKISAVVLALILCFSVVVLPASAAGFDAAYALPADKKVAIKVEFDKDTYNPGETATVRVYVRADDASVFGAGALVFGLNSAVFAQADNTSTNIKASSVANDTYTSFYKTPSTSVWTAPLGGTNLTKVTAANSAEENTAYDWYAKIVIARNMNATHENAGALNNGLPGSEINADTAPYLQFNLKVSESAAPGTPISIAIPTGSVSSAQSYWKIFNDPGNSTAATNTNLTTTDMTYTVATASVAAAGPVVTKTSGQVKMTPTSATTVADAFSFRVVSSISDADWTTYFANTGVADATTNAITKAGFVAYKGTSGFDMAAAQALAKSGAAQSGDYSNATTDYIQKTSGAAASFGARIEFTSQPYDVTYVAYVEYLDSTGATQYAFYEAAGTALLQTNYTTIVNNYLAAFHYAG